jgi:DNA-binding LacI/PurR family transcriptional regulator
MGPPGLLTTKERSQGYMDGLKMHKIPFDKSLLYSSDLTTNSTTTALEKLLQLRAAPTAIIAFKDQIALDAMHHLKQMPKKNRKIEFIGFGNHPMLKYLDNPPIASLEEECTSIGRAAGEILMSRIKQPDQKTPAKSIKFECTLKVLK